MTEFSRPIIIISKCLTFDACRYNGEIISDPLVEKLKEFVDFKPVCPEVQIGLGIPRDPIRIILEKNRHHLYQPATGKDFTEKMIKFTDSFLASIGEADGLILKFGSPSCGISNVKHYHGFQEESASRMGSGLFGGEVINRFNNLPVEDEERLKNFTIREHFLTVLFTLAAFRRLREAPDMGELVQFHSKNKLLLLAYNQSKMRLLGKIVANHEKLPVEEVYRSYEVNLKAALLKIPKFTAHINVLEHALGGMSGNLNSREKQFFLNSIEEYRCERISLSALLHILQAWAIRFDNKYLLNQSYLEPYPRKLTEIYDSGKGGNPK